MNKEIPCPTCPSFAICRPKVIENKNRTDKADFVYKFDSKYLTILHYSAECTLLENFLTDHVYEGMITFAPLLEARTKLEAIYDMFGE